MNDSLRNEKAVTELAEAAILGLDSISQAERRGVSFLINCIWQLTRRNMAKSVEQAGKHPVKQLCRDDDLRASHSILEKSLLVTQKYREHARLQIKSQHRHL